MVWFTVRRILWAFPILIVSSIVVFIGMQIATDPAAIRGAGIDSEDVLRLREDMGLDKPAHEQYIQWLGDFVTGDLGDSFRTGRPVWPELWEAMRNTLQLGAFAYIIYVTVGLTIGVVAALRHNSWFDHGATGSSFVALSFPPFISGLLLQIIVGITLKESLGEILKISNGTRYDMWTSDRFYAMVLPAVAVAIQQIAVYNRYMRSSMLDVLNSDYLRMARAKGVSERRVILRHAVRNALIPFVTFTAVDIGSIVGGLIITEQIFSWHGMGLYFLEGFGNGDYTQILPWTMIVVSGVVLFNLIADLLYGVLDPRIRHA